MTKKKIKPELYWIWEEEADDEGSDGPFGPFSTVEEILELAASNHDLHLHSFAVRPGGPLVAKVLIGRIEYKPLDTKQITNDAVEGMIEHLCGYLEDYEGSGFEIAGNYKQQRQHTKQFQEAVKQWAACLVSTVPTLVSPETHVVPFDPVQHRTQKLKRRLNDLDLSLPVAPEVQTALDALRLALVAYTPKP